MEKINEQLQRVEEKVQRVLKEYAIAQKEIMRLQKENGKLKEQLQSKTELASQLQQKMDTVKMHGGSMDDKSKKELEKRINTYLKDIDKCLALLHT